KRGNPHFPHQQIAARLLSLSLYYKVLFANSAIVLLGALAGTAITLRVASVRGQADFDVPLAAIFAVCGLALTGLLNALVLRAAFSPLSRLQDVARRVREGNLSVRADPSPLADAEIAQIAGTLNQILDEVQAYEEQMRALSGRVIRAQEEERQRIARELHDDTGQMLTLLLIRLKLLESQASTDEVREQIGELRGLVSSAIDQVRQMALNLRPPSLDQLGLVPALRSLIATFTASTHIQVKLDMPREPVSLSPERTIAVYRIAQEALTNIAKHSGARNVAMSLTRERDERAAGGEHDMLRLTVRDDGKGFDPSPLLHRGQRRASGGPGVGLFGMEERARLAGGTLRLQSAPGRGTLINLQLPVEADSYEEANGASTASTALT
ncbi:MAG TPA: HAMP domain-containing sensor histidine kinase, partial [Ktedonobacterales bacterium]